MNIKHIEINVIKGDITDLKVDAVVNPAHSSLKMEKGLAGFLKKEGGQAIEQEALQKGPIEAGQAVWTKAGDLRARYVIHAAVTGPQIRVDETILRRAAASALECADELQLHSLAFPALGCGEGAFAPAGAARIMVQEIMRLCRERKTSLREITFCLYDAETFEVFDNTIRGYVQHMVETLGLGPYSTVDVIIELEEGIVLVERSNPPYGLALPGGFVDYGESLEQAAIREAKEETDLDLVDLRQFHTYSEPDRDPRFHTISTVFIAQGRGIPKSGSDARTLRVVRYEDLPQLEYAFDHKEIIKEYLIEKEFEDDHF